MARSTVVIFIWLLQCFLDATYEGCESPQYLQYGKSGVIDCFFHENFTSIFWYDSTNIVVDKPIVTLINSIKGGQGYISGKFDISSNGSLIITDVGEGHGKNFTVAKFVSMNLDGDPMTFVVSAVIKGVISDECDSPQYLEYGRNSTVQCLFQKNFVSLLWYNSTDTVVDAPIVTYTQSVKSGRGFESGEFDIFSNGSLVIHEVELVHEHNYTVVKFTDLNEVPAVFVVRVIVTVKSLLEGPVIDKCESNNKICFTELDGPSAVNCIVRGVRPAVSLKWLTLTGSGDHNISSKISSIGNNVTFSSRAVTLDAFAYSPVLSLLVCQAEFAPGVLQRDKSLVLVQNSRRNLLSIPPVMKYAPLGSALELPCARNKSPHLQVVWKRSLSFDNQYQDLMFGVFMENYIETRYNDHFQLGENGSLILRQVDQQHDGFYGCIYGDGITDGMTKYKVVTYVSPDPAYPVVEGCNNNSHCVLEVNRKGNLTCSMTGIRPKVNLQWMESNETSSGEITFFDHTTRVSESGGTSNITLTSSYIIISLTQVTVKCGVSGPGSDIFPSSSTFVALRVVRALVKEPDDSTRTRNHSARIVILVLAIVVVLVCAITLFISAKRAHDWKVPVRNQRARFVIVLLATSSVSILVFGAHLFISAKEIEDSGVRTGYQIAGAVNVVFTACLLFVVGRTCKRTLLISVDYRCRKRKRRKEASLEDCEIHERLPVPHSDTGNQSRSGKFARNEETPDFESLLLLSRHLGTDWKDVAKRLLLEESHVCNIEADYSSSVKEASFSMLMLWKLTNSSDATLDTLVEALKEAGRKDLAYLMQSPEDFAGSRLSLNYLDLAVDALTQPETELMNMLPVNGHVERI